MPRRREHGKVGLARDAAVARCCREDVLPKRLLHRLFKPGTPLARSEAETDYPPLQGAPATLESEYEKLVAAHLERFGIDVARVEIRVTCTGRHPGGREIFLANLRLTSWQRDAAVRLLLGLPLLERKVRKTLATLWLSDVSIFEGICLGVGGELLEGRAQSELRRALVALDSGGTDSDAGD